MFVVVCEFFCSFSCRFLHSTTSEENCDSHSCWQNLESARCFTLLRRFFFNRLIPRLELRTLCGASHPSASEVNYRVRGWRGRMRTPNGYIFATQGGHTNTSVKEGMSRLFFAGFPQNKRPVPSHALSTAIRPADTYNHVSRKENRHVQAATKLVANQIIRNGFC